jgi:hypothetical protein
MVAMSLELNTIHTAARIDADRQPAHLERARQRREAAALDAHRAHVVRRFGARVSQVGAWLQGLPTVALPDVAPALEAAQAKV